MIDLQVEVYARIDWGSKTHQACVLYEGGKQLGERSFAHGGEGIGTLFRLFGEFASGGASPVRVDIEVPHGTEAKSLLAAGFAMYSISPRQLVPFPV